MKVKSSQRKKKESRKAKGPRPVQETRKKRHTRAAPSAPPPSDSPLTEEIAQEKARALEEKKRSALAKSVAVPAVYRERGYMVLALTRYDDDISFFEVTEARMQSIGGPAFLDRYHLMAEVSPFALALNLIARFAEGNYTMSVQILRRLIDMVTLNREELLKLSERALAREYSRIMGLTKPIARVSKEVKERYVNEMIARLQQTTEALKGEEASEGAPPPTSSPVEGESKEKGVVAMAKKAKSGKKVSGAAAKKKAAAVKTYPATSKKNPYREGSKKRKAFDIFAKGGERKSILAAIHKLGVTEATSASWVNLFRKV